MRWSEIRARDQIWASRGICVDAVDSVHWSTYRHLRDNARLGTNARADTLSNTRIGTRIGAQASKHWRLSQRLLA